MPSAPSTRSASDAQSSARIVVETTALRSSSSSRTSASSARATCFSRTSSRRTTAPGGTERIKPWSTRTSAFIAKSATSSRASHSPSSAYASRPPRASAAAVSSTFSKTSSRVCANVSSSSAEEGPLGISTARVAPALTWRETCRDGFVSAISRRRVVAETTTRGVRDGRQGRAFFIFLFLTGALDARTRRVRRSKPVVRRANARVEREKRRLQWFRGVPPTRSRAWRRSPSRRRRRRRRRPWRRAGAAGSPCGTGGRLRGV